MQDYIGVKMVKAEPQEKNGKDGYKVVYPDGYVSWSPKDVFESAYLPLSDPNTITDAEVDSFLSEINAKPTSAGINTVLIEAQARNGSMFYEVASSYYEEAKSLAIGRIKDRLRELLGFVLQWGKSGLRTK